MFKVGEEYYLREEYYNIKIIAIGFSKYAEPMVEIEITDKERYYEEYVDGSDDPVLSKTKQLTIADFLRLDPR